MVELAKSPKSQKVENIVVPAAVLWLVNVNAFPDKHCTAFEMVKLGIGAAPAATVTFKVAGAEVPQLLEAVTEIVPE